MSGAPTEHRHAAAFYASDEQFRSLIVPFVEEGIAAGQPVILSYGERKSALLRGWLREPSRAVFQGGTGLYATPAATIAAYGRLFAEHVAAGATGIRIAGDVPHEGNGGRFDGWDRYESAVNVVWQHLPVRSLCLYDAATVPAAVRDVVERTHPHLVGAAGGPRANSRYQEPSVFIGRPAHRDPLESSPPTVELADPTPAQARHAVRRTARGHVGDGALEDLELAVSEAVANASVHGRPPVTFRAWVVPGRVLAHVHDTGQGPGNYLAGLIASPPIGQGAGIGLWISHQLDLDIDLIREPGGFTVRIGATAKPGPHAPAAG